MHQTEPSANSLVFIHVREPALLLLFSVLALAGGCTHSRSQETSQSRQPMATTPLKPEIVVICPDGDIQKTGSTDHKVSLTWNPSPTASTSAQIRYCVYRTQDHPVQRSDYLVPIDKTPCRVCTRVNETAVSDTQLIDNQVTNGAHYCYVAVAMQIGESAFSGFSNQVQADIPQDPAPVPSQISSGKLCVDMKSAARPLKKQRRK